jgi:hypothetical protein
MGVLFAAQGKSGGAAIDQGRTSALVKKVTYETQKGNKCRRETSEIALHERE